jgi:putative colanic acid biosynthesis UDP-glucose lipid carrier transferase
MAGVPMLRSTETPFLGASRWIKRVMDVIISGVLLTILSPLMLGIALLIKMTSPGPVLFRQERYGVGGKCIGVLKFRSMTHNRPADGVQQATRGDARITPLGRILRKTSLDELPQFLNVLMGSMSVVGPRPHAVEHNELYRRKIKGYMLRHKVKPGITGLAQVSGFRGETDALEKMEARIAKDLEYINRWSLWLDIQIIIRTVGVVVYDKNAY